MEVIEIIKDLYYTNKSIAKQALDSTIKNWPIIFTGLFYSTVTLMLLMILGSLWILAGFAMVIITSALISNYLYLINAILNRGYFTLQDFKEGFSPYLRKVWSISFIFYAASLIINFISPLITGIIGYRAFSLIIVVLSFVFFNPIPEVTYQKHYGPWDTITYTVEFVKDNWIEWFVPNLVLLLIFQLVAGRYFNVFGIISNVFNYFLSFTSIFTSPKGIIIYIFGQVWFTYFTLYRGYLFEKLSSSNRRKRLFMRKF